MGLSRFRNGKHAGRNRVAGMSNIHNRLLLILDTVLPGPGLFTVLLKVRKANRCQAVMKNDLRYKDLQLTTLRSFCEVATARNFTEAGKQLRLSTPTVWQQVRALERKFNVRLVRRQGRSVELTVEGKLLFELVRGHVAGLDSLVRLFETRRTDLPRHLSIASSPYFMSCHLPQPTQTYIAENPSIHVNFAIVDLPKDVIRAVSRSDCDLGVTIQESSELPLPTLSYEKFFDLPLSVLMSSRHPLARKKELLPEDLVNYPMVMPPEDGVDALALKRILQKHNLTDRVRPVMETKQIDIIARYVALNVGIAVCHISPMAKPMLPGTHLRVLDPGISPLSAVIVTRKGAHLPTMAEDFLKIARRTWNTAFSLPASPDDQTPRRVAGVRE